MYPSGIKFINASVGLKTMTPEGYDAVIDRIGPAAEKLAAQGANAVVLMGTSLSFYKGAAFNERLDGNAEKGDRLARHHHEHRRHRGAEGRGSEASGCRHRVRRRSEPPACRRFSKSRASKCSA